VLLACFGLHTEQNYETTLSIFIAAFIAGSLFAQSIDLPAPQKTGGMPLMMRWQNGQRPETSIPKSFHTSRSPASSGRLSALIGRWQAQPLPPP